MSDDNRHVSKDCGHGKSDGAISECNARSRHKLLTMQLLRRRTWKEAAGERSVAQTSGSESTMVFDVIHDNIGKWERLRDEESARQNP